MTLKNGRWRPLFAGFAALSAGFAAIGTLASCAMGPKPAPAIASNCSSTNFPIYFAKGSDVLSDQARAAIRAGADMVRTCQVREVDIFGLTSADGPAAVDLALSKRRAANVAQALAAAGLPEPLFDVEGLGASTARTAKGGPAMLQRKTLVVIQVASTPQTS